MLASRELLLLLVLLFPPSVRPSAAARMVGSDVRRCDKKVRTKKRESELEEGNEGNRGHGPMIRRHVRAQCHQRMHELNVVSYRSISIELLSLILWLKIRSCQSRLATFVCTMHGRTSRRRRE